jgi:hypothetical protein
MAKIHNPTAGLVIYNYKDRGGAVNISSQDVDKLYITKSIISISTSKNKSSPAGRFEITLAPTKNWISTISIGSWIEIHMSPNVISQKDLDSASIETLKMIGMIDSVRMSVSVDQATGARITTYNIIGRDWGGALESCVYIDSAVTVNTDTALQAAFRLSFDEFFLSLAKDGLLAKLSSDNLVAKILNYWGVNSAAKNKDFSRYAPISEFVLPTDLSSKISNKDKKTLASSIKLVTGTLAGEDKYQSGFESVGFIDPARLIGTNTVWALMSTHSNDIVNELIADLRWEDRSKGPQFTIYKRVKPFWLPGQALNVKPEDSPAQATTAQVGDKRIISNFFNLRKINIQKESVLGLETGDNAQDIVNFIEIMPVFPSGLLPENKNPLLAEAKNKSSIYDNRSFARYGIKPMFYSSLFLPPQGDGVGSYSDLAAWLPVLKKWFFDCHKMLNGTITILGKNDYIGVGDNIVLDSEIFGDLNYVKEELKGSYKDFKIIAHVESVSHRFTYIENGSRSFVTTVNFVRGVVSDKNAKNLLGIGSLGVSTKSTDVPAQSKSTKNSTYKDGESN